MRPNDSIQEALAVAQSNGMLLAPHDRALRSALYRRANDPALIGSASKCGVQAAVERRGGAPPETAAIGLESSVRTP